MKTATYRHGNTSFSVVGPLRFVDGSDPSGLGSEFAGTIIVADYDAHGNSFAWARACQACGCIGVVMLTRVNPTVTSLEAWIEADRAVMPGEQISTTPLVILDGYEALASVDDVRSRPGPIHAVMDSSDIVEGTSASALFESPGATFAFVIAWLINVVNMAGALYKFAAFAIDRDGNLRAVPLYPSIVFTTGLVSSIFRMLWFADAAFYNLQSFSKVFYRVLITVFIPIGFAGTAAIGMAMHDHLKQGKAVSVRHKAAVYSLLSVLGIVFTVDIVGTFLAAVKWHEYFNVTYISTFYFLMNTPVSILFIKYGAAVSRALLNNDKISTVERARSLQFARRVTISGVVGVVLLLTQIMFISMSTNSVSHYVMLYTLSVSMGAIQCFTFLIAYRPRSSIFDTLAETYLPSGLISSIPRTTSDDKSKDAAQPAAERTVTATAVVTGPHMANNAL
ncbi:PA domain-containing protein [Plasmodiophora brassicae]